MSKKFSGKVVSLHPGVVATELGRYMFEGKAWLEYVFLCCCCPCTSLMIKSSWWGAQTSLHCCLVPYKNLENGAYYSDCKVKKETLTKNWEEEASKLWEISEEAVKEYV